MKFLPAQIWMIAGLGLIFLEALTPGFVIVFFGMAALTVALIVWLIPAVGTPLALGLFAALSVAYLLTLRRLAKKVFSGDRDSEAVSGPDEAGQVAALTAAINPPMEGRVEVFGTSWKAISDRPLAKGAEVVVTGRKNLTLTVRGIEKEGRA